ncbi:MAG: glutathione S-transferase [Salinarimonadaceae bacterium]|nr:MAG: glutathione S-transferase [Salinarimonadaceae bacterium]
MKLYDGGRAPNPRRVRIFLAEKDISVDLAPVDLGAMGHRSAEYAALNPWRLTPLLLLDDGTTIAESIAICRYFEELFPDPALFGSSAIARARVEMWQRRVELGLFTFVGAVFRHLHPGMAEMENPQIPAWGEANKPKVVHALTLLDAHLAGSEYLCEEGFSVADITGLVALDFMKPAKLVIPEDLANVRRWHAALKARPSAAA